MTRANALKAALRTRYAPPEWVVLEEVRSSTGHVASPTYVDAFAMSTYPSRGLQTIGFEIKVSRQDWLRELQQPDKADSIAKYCDLWYVVTDDASILTLDEVPANWGVLVYKTSRFQVLKQAKPLDSAPLDRAFIAALLRKATSDCADHVPKDSVHELVEQQLAADRAVLAKQEARKSERDDHALEDYRSKDAELSDLVRLRLYDIVRLCREYPWLRHVLDAAVLSDHRERVHNILSRQRQGLMQINVAVERALEALETRDD